MRSATIVCLSVFTLGALALAGCKTTGASAGSGLVVVPPDVEKAEIPPDLAAKSIAVVLYDIGYVHYDPMDIGHTYYPSYVYSRFTKVKLLTRAATEGGHFGTIQLRHLDDLKEIEAYVEKPDGTRNVLKQGDFVKTVLIKDAIPDYTPPIDYYETTILFPGIGPGDTIYYHYALRGRELNWAFNHLDAPVLFSKYMVTRPPRRAEIQPVIYDLHDLKPEKTEETGMATGMSGLVGIRRQATFDIWTAHNVPAVVYEAGMPPLMSMASRVRIWQGERRWDWNTLGQTYYKWFTHYGRPPSKPAELAEKATAGISEPRDRARAIHDWVKANLNIQDVDTLSWVPREYEIATLDIGDLLEEKNASPEQAANLMWLMMKSVGIDATVLLAIDDMNPPVIEELPYLYQFTHPLLALDDGTLIDTTHRQCPFGQIPWVFEGKKGLWLKGATVSFRDIPESSQQANRRTTTIRGKVDPAGDVEIDYSSEIRGQLAFAFRRFFGPMTPKEREEQVRYLLTAGAEKGLVEEYSFTHMDEPAEPLGLKAKIKVPGYSEVLRDKMVMKLGAFVHHMVCPVLRDRLGLYLYVCPKPMTDTRANPVQFPFKRLEEMDVKVDFPAGFQLQALPKGFSHREISTGTAVGVQNSYGAKDGSLIVVRKLSVNERFVGDKGYAQLSKTFKRFEGQKNTLITLEIPK
ncbi:MAG: DUF3857 domain-containing protein [Deltaproteobacteria bacterium]|nr:DUF3857 domain-containing protein [Deltaproteobacteria bacterium]